MDNRGRPRNLDTASMLALLLEVKDAYSRLLIPGEGNVVLIDGLRVFYGAHNERRAGLIARIDKMLEHASRAKQIEALRLRPVNGDGQLV